MSEEEQVDSQKDGEGEHTPSLLEFHHNSPLEAILPYLDRIQDGPRSDEETGLDMIEWEDESHNL